MSQNPEQPKDEKSLAPVVYTPGGLNHDIVKSNQNPNPALDQNYPFSAGRNMTEVEQTQDMFTFPLDTDYSVYDAIAYFSEPVNRNRYNYEQQQLIIARINRAAQKFGIDIEGVNDKVNN